jgi:membrane-associated protein
MDDKPADTSPSEETKRKFREALERKKTSAQDRPGHLDGGSAIHGTHGAAGNKREFRRKSG